MKTEHHITLEQAVTMTRRHRENRKKILHPQHAEKDLIPISETFSREAFDHLLAQPGCTAVRIYFSMNEEFQLRQIIVGVDGDGRDMVPATIATQGAATTTTDSGDILEAGKLCPPYCSTASPLNS